MNTDLYISFKKENNKSGKIQKLYENIVNIEENIQIKKNKFQKSEVNVEKLVKNIQNLVENV